jgi:hypothetical protein
MPEPGGNTDERPTEKEGTECNEKNEEIQHSKGIHIKCGEQVGKTLSKRDTAAYTAFALEHPHLMGIPIMAHMDGHLQQGQSADEKQV